jgi:hypothetical protein
MILSSAAIYLPGLFLGFALINLLWSGSWRNDLALKLGLAICTGLGVTSALFFFWILLFGPQGKLFIGAETILAIALLLAAWRHRQTPTLNEPFSKTANNWFSHILIIAVAALLAACAIYLVCYSLMNPNAHFDAWAIWTLRARAIFRGGLNWKDAFSPALDWSFHADYPLLIPLNITVAWEVIGNETLRTPMLQAALFCMATLLLLAGGTYKLRGRNQSMIAVLILAATPWFIILSGYQIADQPEASYVLAVCLLLFLTVKSQKDSWRFAFLCGLMAGCAAWTKNEGILVLLGAALVLAIFSHHRARNLAVFVAGSALPVSALAGFKLTLAPPGDLFAGQTIAMLVQRMVDPQRYWITFSSLIKDIFWFGRSPLPVLLVIGLYAFLMGRRVLIREDQRGVISVAVLLLFIFLGYFGVFIITPHPLQWHIDNSAERLLFHFFPSAIWLLMMWVHSPEEVLQK